jgi:phage terminase large subunit-like protein
VRQTARLITLKNEARRAGWLKWLRKGEGEEADERALLNGCWFVPQRGEHVIEWAAKYAVLVEGAWRGKPFDLLDWQIEFLMRLFGWVRYSKEWSQVVRRFRWAYLEVPKKNGKSPLMALVGAYLLFGDGNQSVKNFSVATSKKQAKIVHHCATSMCLASPELKRISRVRTEDGFKVIEYPQTGSSWSIAAADAMTADGINGNCLADELHRWVNWEFWNSLRWMLAALPEGLFFAITTGGRDKGSICGTQHEKTKAINEGRQRDEQFLGRIYAANPEDDVAKEKTWLRANPSLGKTSKAILKMSDFRADYRTALQDPTQWTDFLRLRLGIWSTAESAWVSDLGGIQRWDAGAAARKKAGRKRIDCYERFSEKKLHGRSCIVAIDGATHHDTTAAVFAFLDEKQDELIRLLPYYWLPEAEAARLGEKVPFRQWSSEGYITLTPGDACDYDRVLHDLTELFDLFRVERFYFDPLFQAEYMTQRLSEATGVERCEFPQRLMYFSPAMKSLGRLIAIKKVRHNGHPLFTWQLGHTKAYSDVNGNIRPVRQKKGDHRTIDGPVAGVMAIRDLVAADEARPVWYDEEDNQVEYL